MKKCLFFILLFPSLFAIAQTEAEIRNHYQEINKQITESKKESFEGPLYCNEWITNKNSKSWPAVGIFHETTDFWYDDSPDHLAPSDRNPRIVLVKVIVNRKSAELSTNEEYLYKNGKLVFFYSDEGEEGKEWETRVYFNANGMFKSSVKADGKELTAKDLTTEDYKDFKPNTLIILRNGKKYQDLFLKDML